MSVLAAALPGLPIAPTSALAGGFATVGLSSTPGGTRPRQVRRRHLLGLLVVAQG